MDNKKINRIDTKKTYFLFAGVLSFLILLVFNIVLTPIYETKDDVTMALIVEGAYGKSNGLVFFQNIIYTKFLTFLYNIIPTIKWYTIIQLYFLYISFYSISYILFKKLKLVNGLFVNFFLSIFIGHEFFYVFQFTRTAALCSIAGLIVLFDSFCNENKLNRYVKIVLGYALIIYAGLVRFSSVELVAGMMCVIGLIRIIEIIKKKEQVFKQIVSYMLVFAIALAIPFALDVYNGRYYKQESLKYYQQYNSKRSQLYDFGWPDYESNKDLYESLNISKEDYYYFYTWNMDSDVLNIDTLNSLASAKSKRNDLIHSLIDAVLTILKNLASDYKFYIYLSICVLCVIFCKEKWWVVLLQLMIFGLLQTYLEYSGRSGLDRVNICFYTSGIISLLYCLESKISSQKALIRNICIMLVYSVFVSAMFIVNPIENSYNDNASAMYDEFSKDKDHLYLCTFSIGDEQNLYLSQSVGFYEPVSENYATNIYNTGGWDFVMPYQEKILDEYKVKNIYADSINNDKVYFVTASDGEVLIRYIQRHYDKNARLDLVKTTECQNIFKVVS